MIYIPTEVTDWVPRQDFRKCSCCGAYFHKTFSECPRCKEHSATPVADLVGEEGQDEVTWPVPSNAS